MRWLPYSLPDGLPVSLWFFVITGIVFLLQLIPITGVFLMIFGAAFWSVVLINLGMAGLIVEGVTGRASPLWLIIPALYLGGYYWLYRSDQHSLRAVAGEFARYNQGKSLPFDPERRDLVVEGGVGASEFTERFGLARAFSGQGQVYLVGTEESCALLRDNAVFRSAGIHSNWITREGPSRWKKLATGFCTIMMPGKPDKGIVRITEEAGTSRHRRLPVRIRTFTARDETAGTSAAVRSGSAEPLKRFPMPVMGCALNSGAASWDCFAGFMRDTVPLPLGMPRFSGGAPIVAKLLGLAPSDDFAAVAIGPDRFQPMAERADAELVAKELGWLEKVLADPATPIKESGFSHLPKRTEILAPYADRIFAALETLQGSKLYASSNGVELWRLVAALPEAVLGPYRARMAEWMQPGSMRPWTDQGGAFSRLDVTDPVQREIVLTRLERPLGDIPGHLLPAFCRLGAAAPEDAKRRLLAVWHARGKVAAGRSGERGYDHVQLYLVLARMGLKAEAGKVEQRYMGKTFTGIWNEVSPDTPESICDLSVNDIGNRYR